MKTKDLAHTKELSLSISFEIRARDSNLQRNLKK